MGIREACVFVFSVASIIGLIAISFAICRMCSAYYDTAICKWYVKIPRAFCTILISFDHHSNSKCQTVWVSQYDRQKMSLVGLVSYLVLSYWNIQFAYIIFRLWGWRLLGWNWENPEKLRVTFSNILGAMAIFGCLDVINNWKLWGKR